MLAQRGEGVEEEGEDALLGEEAFRPGDVHVVGLVANSYF